MLLLELAAQIDRMMGADSEIELEQFRDALVLKFPNGVNAEVRVGSADEFAVSWEWRARHFRIDTAPLHWQLSTFPNHLHDEDGEVRDDPLFRPGLPVAEQVCRIIRALETSPQLDRPVEPGSA